MLILDQRLVFTPLIVFLSNSLVICEQKSDLLMKQNESLPPLFCHLQPEQITHGRFFVKSNGSKSLKLLYKKEWMSEEQWERFVIGQKKGKKVKNIWKIQQFWVTCSFFASDLLFICELFARITSKSFTGLFFKEWQ